MIDLHAIPREIQEKPREWVVFNFSTSNATWGNTFRDYYIPTTFNNNVMYITQDLNIRFGDLTITDGTV